MANFTGDQQEPIGPYGHRSVQSRAGDGDLRLVGSAGLVGVPLVGDDVGVTTQSPAPSAPASAPRRGMRGNARSMVISMVVVTVAVIAWVALVPRVQKVDRPAVDVQGIAREVGLGQKWAVAYPQPAPKGWIPANVLLVRAENQPPTWQAGYDLPDGGYIAIEQTKSGDADWVKAQTNGGTDKGSVQIDGVTWSKRYNAGNGQSSLLSSKPVNGLATVVTGKAGWDQLQTFVKALKPVPTA